MISGECDCIVCGNKNKYCINTNLKEYKNDDYTLISKNKDGSFNSEIYVNCNYCGAIYKIERKINFVPDVILEEPYDEAEVYK